MSSQLALYDPDKIKSHDTLPFEEKPIPQDKLEPGLDQNSELNTGDWYWNEHTGRNEQCAGEADISHMPVQESDKWIP